MKSMPQLVPQSRTLWCACLPRRGATGCCQTRTPGGRATASWKRMCTTPASSATLQKVHCSSWTLLSTRACVQLVFRIGTLQNMVVTTRKRADCERMPCGCSLQGSGRSWRPSASSASTSSAPAARCPIRLALTACQPQHACPCHRRQSASFCLPVQRQN